MKLDDEVLKAMWNLHRQHPDWSSGKIANELSEQGMSIHRMTVYRYLKNAAADRPSSEDGTVAKPAKRRRTTKALDDASIGVGASPCLSDALKFMDNFQLEGSCSESLVVQTSLGVSNVKEAIVDAVSEGASPAHGHRRVPASPSPHPAPGAVAPDAKEPTDVEASESALHPRGQQATSASPSPQPLPSVAAISDASLACGRGVTSASLTARSATAQKPRELQSQGPRNGGFLRRLDSLDSLVFLGRRHEVSPGAACAVAQ
mmetsp:Transcript_55017/g.152517  ORF Transcript_55017/g.152517 Transcript_55017/m.152517 type:complete len:261 (-) Transcript_55017:208-990(-)